MLSTKSGGPLAAGWAILHYFGLEGYQDIVRQVMTATKKLIAGIDAQPDLVVLGRPDMCIFAIESATINVFQLADVMKEKGWLLQPQFSKTASRQPNIHIIVNQATVPHVDTFLQDLDQAIQKTKSLLPLDVSMVKEQIDSLLQAMPPDEAAGAFYQLAGIEGSQLPGEMAFGFNMQELETPARLNLPVITIVAVDGAFGMEKSAQRRVFGREAP